MLNEMEYLYNKDSSLALRMTVSVNIRWQMECGTQCVDNQRNDLLACMARKVI